MPLNNNNNNKIDTKRLNNAIFSLNNNLNNIYNQIQMNAYNSDRINNSNNYNNDHQPISNAIVQLWQYYQSVYEPKNESIHILEAFKTKLFSGTLRRIAEFGIDEELHPASDSFWKSMDETFCIPEVYINNERVAVLIDTGASSSVMSFKFSMTETIESLKLIFRARTRKITVANGAEIKTHGQLLKVPVTIDGVETLANPHVMDDLTYDLILGRDWCEANGVVIDFNKKKIYLLKPQPIVAPSEFVN